jgi:Na+/phosphate symporter
MQWLPLIVMVVGILMYALCVNTKLQEIGRISFFCGLFVTLLHIGGPLLPRV